MQPKSGWTHKTISHNQEQMFIPNLIQLEDLLVFQRNLSQKLMLTQLCRMILTQEDQLTLLQFLMQVLLQQVTVSIGLKNL